MPTWTEADHPRADAGKFCEKPASDPGTEVLPANSSHLNQVCEEAMLPIMAEMLQIVADREQVPPGVFDRLTADNIEAMFWNHIGPAIDLVEYDLKMGKPAGPDRDLDPAEVEAHVAAICEQAGCNSMADVLGVVADRDEVPNGTFMRLTPEDITELYEERVELYVNDLEQELLDSSCRDCGADLEDGEGSDGWCGNCADARTCIECGEHIADDRDDIPEDHLCDDCRDES